MNPPIKKKPLGIGSPTIFQPQLGWHCNTRCILCNIIYTDSLAQDCGNSSALATELPQSCAEPSKWHTAWWLLMAQCLHYLSSALTHQTVPLLKQNIDNKYKLSQSDFAELMDQWKLILKMSTSDRLVPREVLVECIHSGVLHVLWQLPHMNFSASICIEQSTVSSTDYWSTQEKYQKLCITDCAVFGMTAFLAHCAEKLRQLLCTVDQ